MDTIPYHSVNGVPTSDSSSQVVHSSQFKDPEQWKRFKDLLFLGTLYSLYIGTYIRHLGFYSDDWPVLADLKLASDQTLHGLFSTIYQDHVLMRPIQFLQFAGQYYLFGVNPLGHHIFNSIIIVLGVWAFYLVLIQVGLGRWTALSISVIYLFLPHYSSTRFWITASMINLSMLMFFISTYFDIRALQAPKNMRLGFKVLATIGLLVSALAYEVFIPLFCVNIIMVNVISRKLKNPVKIPLKSMFNRDVIVSQSVNLFFIVLIAVFKGAVTDRPIPFDLISNLVFYIKVLVKSAYVSYGLYGLGIPYVLSKVNPLHFNFELIGIALGIGCLTFLYLWWISKKSKEVGDGSSHTMVMIFVGILLFLLGLGIFVLTNFVIVTATGTGNRTSIAASIGVAITQVAAILWLSRIPRVSPWTHTLKNAGVSLLCFCYVLVLGDLAAYWTEANREQISILEAVYQEFPSFSPNTTLIIDGVCPYAGPAVVFNSWWDLAGALRLMYQDASLNADIVTPDLTIQSEGLHVSLFWGGMQHIHPYSDPIKIFNIDREEMFNITDEDTAVRYFNQISPNHGSKCPISYPDRGVPIYSNQY